LTGIHGRVKFTRMKTSELVGRLKELKRTAGHDAATSLEDGGGPGWPIGDVRRVRSAELKEQGIDAKTVAVTIEAAVDDPKELNLEALIKKLNRCAESAEVYAEVGSAETPLVKVTDARLGTSSNVVIFAGGAE